MSEILRFAVLYRWRVDPTQVGEFVEAWTDLTAEIAAQCGSGGSRLHQCGDETWLAYAQWPSRQAWADASVATPRANAARETMRRVAESIAPPEELHVHSDRLAGRS